MTYITVDARECGAGKTRGSTGIFARIHENKINNTRTIVALPSILLMTEYLSEFPDAYCINSDECRNVQKALFAAMSADHKVIIITHRALLDLEPIYHFRKNFDLIIDEAIDPWRINQYTRKYSDSGVEWEKHIDVASIPVTVNTNVYYAVTINTQLLKDGMLSQSPLLRDLTSHNWVQYAKEHEIQEMKNRVAGETTFISELSPRLLDKWKSVHIAAAAFDRTYMSWWMKKHKIKYFLTNEFTPHTTKINIHYLYMGDKQFEWSRWKKENDYAWLPAQLFEYVNAHKSDAKILRLKNNSDEAGVYLNECPLPHNTAGMNKWKDYEHVALESCLNPSPELDAWFRGVLTDHFRKMSKTDMGNKIFAARTGYTYYQSLMRSCLRDNKPADVYVIDSRAAGDLAVYFDIDVDTQLHEIQVKKPLGFFKERKKRGPNKKPKENSRLTKQEENKASRFKRNNTEICEGLNTRHILQLIEEIKGRR